MSVNCSRYATIHVIYTSKKYLYIYEIHFSQIGMKMHVFDFLFISIYINIVNRDRFKCTYSVFHV